jgi:hypothetical protein
VALFDLPLWFVVAHSVVVVLELVCRLSKGLEVVWLIRFFFRLQTLRRSSRKENALSSTNCFPKDKTVRVALSFF